MIYEDPRDNAPDTVDDPKVSEGNDTTVKTEKDEPKDDYQYTDWASI